MKIFTLLLLFCISIEVGAVPGTEKGIQSLPQELRQEAESILKKYQALQKLNPEGQGIHLDLEDGAYTSVYSKPGIFSTEDCAADSQKNKKNPSKGCTAMGWPDNKSKLFSTGHVEFQVEEDEEGEQVLRTYTEVQFAYDREGKIKSGTGWIAEDFIAFAPSEPSYSEIMTEKLSRVGSWMKEKWNKLCISIQKPTTPLSQSSSAKKNLNDIVSVAEAAQKKVEEINAEKRAVSNVVSELSSSVGQCMLKPPNEAPEKFAGNLVYDQFVLPAVKKINPPKNVRKEDGTALTQKDLIDIDVMARTIYAEMASCTPIGVQYPMAVARVIRNREQEMQQKPNSISEFIKYNSEHDTNKSLLSRAATSPVLISAWNQDIIDFNALKAARKKAINPQERKKINPNPDTKAFYKPNVSGLLHTLCPPSDSKGLCYTGYPPDKNMTIAWENVLKVAVETVLFPKQFEKKTAELAGIKHYTSNRNRFYDFVEVHPSIEARQIDSKRCLNLWRPRTEAEKKSKK